MALTPEERRIVSEAWARGLRTQEEIFPLIGRSVPPPAGQAGVLTAPAMPAEPTWAEQGGLLGAAARAPIAKQAFQTLGLFEKFAFTPVSTSVALTAQGMIPGEQNLEKQVRLGAQEAKAEGEGIFGQIGRAFQRGGEAKIAEASLPFTIQTPDWLVGEDKTIKDIDVGRLFAELPFEIIGTKGISAAYRAIRPAGATVKRLSPSGPDKGRLGEFIKPREKPLPWEAKQPKRKKWLETRAQQRDREAVTPPTPADWYTAPTPYQPIPPLLGPEPADWYKAMTPGDIAKSNNLEREGNAVLASAARQEEEISSFIPASINKAAKRLMAELNQIVIPQRARSYFTYLETLKDKVLKLKRTSLASAQSKYSNQHRRANDLVKASQRRLTKLQGDLQVILNKYPNRIVINETWTIAGPIDDLFPGGSPLSGKKLREGIIEEGKISAPQGVRTSIVANAQKQSDEMRVLAQRTKNLASVNKDEIDAKGKPSNLGLVKGAEAEILALQTQILNIQNQAANLMRKNYIDPGVLGGMTGADLIGALIKARSKSPLVKLANLGKPEAAARATAEATTLRSIVQAGGIPTREAAIKAERAKGEKIIQQVSDERQAEVTKYMDAAARDSNGRLIQRAEAKGPPVENHSSEAFPTDTIDVTPGITEPANTFLKSKRIDTTEEFVEYAKRAKPRWLLSLTNWANKNLLQASPPGAHWYNPKRATLATVVAAINLVDPIAVRDSNAYLGILHTGSVIDTSKALSLQDFFGFRDSWPDIASIAAGDAGVPLSRSLTGRAPNRSELAFQALGEKFPTGAEGFFGFRRGSAGEPSIPIKNHSYVGAKALFWTDVLEAYWAHELMGALELAGKFGDVSADVKNFVAPRKVKSKDIKTGELEYVEGFHGYTQYREFFVKGNKALNYQQREFEFTRLFNDLTDVGAASVEDFAKRLRVYLDEIEEAIDPGQAAIRLKNPKFSRKVLQFASGEKAPGISSSKMKRAHALGSHAVAKGVVYDNDWMSQVIELGAYAKREVALRQFADFATSEKTGFGLALDGLAGKIAAIKSQSSFVNLDTATKKVIDEYAELLDAAKAKRDASISLAVRKAKQKTNETNEAFNERIRSAPDATFKDDVHVINQRAFTEISESTNALEFPSKAFWASGQEKIKLVDIHTIFGLHGGIPVDTGAAAALRQVGLEGKVALVPKNELQQIEAALGTIHTLIGKPELQFIPQPGTGFFSRRTIAKMADFWRLTATGFDHAFPMTVGIPLLFRSPAAWVQTFRIQLEAWVDPNYLSSIAKRDEQFMADVKELVERGVATTDPEQFRGLQRLEGGDVDGYISHLMRPEPPQPGLKGVPLRLARLTTLTRFQRGYSGASIATKVYWLRILKPYFTDDYGVVDNIGLKSQIQNLTGSINTASLGVSTLRRQLENFFVGLSPRLTRSVAALVFDAQRGVKNIAARNIDIQYALTQGRKGRSPRAMMQERAGLDPATGVRRELTPDQIVAASAYNKQALALGNLGTALFASSLTFFLFSYAYGRSNDKSHDQAMQEALASIDPQQGKKHLAIDVGGSWVGIGGFWRSLAQLNFKLVWASVEATKGNHGPMREWFSTSQFDNPIISTIKNRGAPAFNFGGMAWERATGTDAAPFDVIDSNWDLVLNGAEEFLPFIIQGRIEGENAASSMFGLFGARTSSMTLGDATVFEAREKLGLEVDSSRDIAESWIKKDVLYPFVQETRQMSAKASNSPLGRWMQRRQELVAEFETLLEREYRAGISDYDLIRLYYEERRKMYARLDELQKQVGMGDFDVNPKDPIAVALKKWRDVYEKEDVLTALKDEKYDIIDAYRAKLYEGFTKEQQDAVSREGSGVYKEIAAVLKPESQARLGALYKKRADWIDENAENPEIANELKLMLSTSMFPTLGEGIVRGIVTGIGKGSRTSGGSRQGLIARPL